MTGAMTAGRVTIATVIPMPASVYGAQADKLCADRKGALFTFEVIQNFRREQSF
jgi:hypothetical protein